MGTVGSASAHLGGVRVPPVLRTAGALAGSLLIVALVVLLLGANPLRTFGVIVTSSLGSLSRLGQTLMIATLLSLTGLAAAIPFTARLWNIGGEGQMFAGALAAAGAGILLPQGLPAPVFVPAAVIAAALAGAAWGAIPGWLRARFDASEIVTSLMLNFVAIQAASYAITEVWPEGFAPQTDYVADNAVLPVLWPGTRINAGLLLAVIAALGAWILMSRTRTGFAVQSLGANPRASRLAGIRTGRTTVLAFAYAGAFAGLAGAVAVLGIHRALVSGFSANYGFIGIAVALLARLNPLWVLPSAMFLAVMRVGSNSLQASVGLSPSVGEILVAVLIVLLMVTGVIRFRYAEDTH